INAPPTLSRLRELFTACGYCGPPTATNSWAQRIRPSSQRIWTERLILYCTPTLNSAKVFGRKNSNLQGAMDERIYRDSGRTYCNKRTFFNARDSSTPSTAEQTPRGITRKAGV